MGRVCRSWSLGVFLLTGFLPILRAQETAPAPTPAQPSPLSLPPVPPAENAPMPINLPVALQLAGVRPIDVAVASQRTQLAAAQLERANVLWLPTLYLGIDYARHDGQTQAIEGNVFTTSRSSFMVGAGPRAVFAVTDALFAPLAARQVVRAREADFQAALNDSLLAVAEAYFIVQQARGELAGALDAEWRTVEVVRRTDKLAATISLPSEADRARAELARRNQAVEAARERWETASADLTRLLRLAPSALVEPLEPPHLQIDLIDLNQPVDDLIPVALVYRPELAAQQALVQATLARLRQERLRPLIPSVLLQGNATNPAGTLSSGYFGGGVNDNLSHFGGRNSMDLQLLWEVQNLGFGNRAAANERRAENRLALLELFRVQDRVAAEVAQAYAQARRSRSRAAIAEEGLRNAIGSAEKNLQGLQARRSGEFLVLVNRPQEVVAAIQSLSQAYYDYYGAVADANRAQFRLYRALGHPAQCLVCPPLTAPPAPARPEGTAQR